MQFSSKMMMAGLVAVVKGAALTSRSLSGQATFYGGNTAGGACSFSTYTIPAGIYGTALSDSNWDTSANCGACVSVTGPAGNTITAMIVDECPGCGTNHLDLFPDAFAKLSAPSVGIIETTWNYVDCPITSPLQVRNKEGVSPYWFSMQVINANKAVSSLQVSTNGGSTWQSTTRKDYNFFENPSGFGTASVDVKVTSIDGDVVIVKNVQVTAGVSATAASNFGKSSAPAVVASSSAVVVSSSPVAVAPKPTSTSAAAVVHIQSTTAQVVPTTSAAPVVAIQSTTPEAAPVTTVIPPSSTATPLPTLPVSSKPTDTISSTTILSTSTIHVAASSTKSKSKCSSIHPTSTTLISSVSPVSTAEAVSTSVYSTYTYTPPAPSNATSVWVPATSATSSPSAGIFANVSPTATPVPFTSSAGHAVAGLGSLLLAAVAAIVLV